MVEQKLTFTWWARDWEKSLEKQEEIFFAMTVGSIAEFLFESTKDKKHIQKLSYEGHLLSLIHKAVGRNSLETRLLMSCIPASIKNFKNSLPSQPSTKSVYRYFKDIRRGIASKKYLSAIKQEIFQAIDDPKPNFRLQSLTLFLLRSLLIKFSSKSMKKLPQRVFGKEFFEIFRQRIIKKLKTKAK